MQLTISSIQDIISSGEVIHSALAETFISKVSCEVGISILACYMDSSLQLLLPAGDSSRIKWKKICADPQFVNYLSLTVYTRANVDKGILRKKDTEEKIASVFLDTVRAEGQKIEYPRTHLPDEMAFYGWQNTPRNEWDESKIIRPIDTPLSRIKITLENISELAMWHYLSGSLKSINRLEIVERIGAKVYCGWDDRSSVTLFVILPDHVAEELTEEVKKACAQDIFSIITAKDQLEIWKSNTFSPVFTSWNLLSEEQRFNLLRN